MVQKEAVMSHTTFQSSPSPIGQSTVHAFVRIPLLFFDHSHSIFQHTKISLEHLSPVLHVSSLFHTSCATINELLPLVALFSQVLGFLQQRLLLLIDGRSIRVKVGSPCFQIGLNGRGAGAEE